MMSVKNTVFLIIAIIILGGLFFLFKPQTQSPSQSITPSQAPQTTDTRQTTITTTPSEQEDNTFEIVVSNKEVTSGPTTITVNQGEQVTLKITSDTAEEVHLHGYDKSVELEPNEQATLSFTADTAGRFPYELEESGTEIGVLEVQPQ